MSENHTVFLTVSVEQLSHQDHI